jgi:hypothetical protein
LATVYEKQLATHVPKDPWFNIGGKFFNMNVVGLSFATSFVVVPFFFVIVNSNVLFVGCKMVLCM